MSAIAGVSMLAYPALGALWPWLMRPRLKENTTGWKITHFGAYVGIIYFQLVQYFLATVGWSFTIYGHEIKANSSVIFPLGLAAILHAYMTQDPINFRKLCISLLIANASMILAIALRRDGWGSSLTPQFWQPLWSEGAISILWYGVCLQAVDISIMIFIYITIVKNTSKIFLCIAPPLLLALTIDALGFSWIIAYFHPHSSTFSIEISSQLPIKLAAGFVYAIWISVYFYCFDGYFFSESPVESARRFFLEVVPRAFKKHAATLALTPSHVRGNPLDIMPERGSKDAVRGIPENQELTPEVQGGRQGGFVAAVGRSAASESRQIVSKGIEAFRRDVPELFRDHLNEWVAYRGEERLGFALTHTELYKELSAHGFDQTEITILSINENSLHKYNIEDLVFPKAGGSLDPNLLLSYVGQWVAWSPDGKTVVAHSKDPAILEHLLESSGLNISQCVLNYIDEATEI